MNCPLFSILTRFNRLTHRTQLKPWLSPFIIFFVVVVFLIFFASFYYFGYELLASLRRGAATLLILVAATLTSFKFPLTSIMWYSPGRPSFSLDRKKTMRFLSVMLLPAVIGLQLPGFTLAWWNFIRFKTFLLSTFFLSLLIHRSP